MSRVAKAPITLPKGVEMKIDGQAVQVKGGKNTLSMTLHPAVQIEMKDNTVTIAAESVEKEPALSGTMRACLNNMVVGVSQGFERKLNLVGVGYRAQAQGSKLNLQLGYSNPIEYAVPEGITVETPTQTEILVKGSDRQKVGQVAAEIRAFRSPEPYKGKGVRYSDERVVMKEAKKK
jgi:large subunit ribosomal protein L6